MRVSVIDVFQCLIWALSGSQNFGRGTLNVQTPTPKAPNPRALVKLCRQASLMTSAPTRARARYGGVHGTLNPSETHKALIKSPYTLHEPLKISEPKLHMVPCLPGAAKAFGRLPRQTSLPAIPAPQDCGSFGFRV